MVGTQSFIEAARANGSPHQRLARALKAGKEEIAGLVRAVELFLERDHDALARAWESTVAGWAAALSTQPGVTAERAFPNEAGQSVPRLRVTIDHAGSGTTSDAVIARLWDMDPRVLVLRADPHSFYITPETLLPGQSDELESKIVEALLRP